MALVTNGVAPMPTEYFDWKMVFDTGWTLDYIRSLSMKDYQDYLQIKDARIKANIK